MGQPPAVMHCKCHFKLVQRLGHSWYQQWKLAYNIYNSPRAELSIVPVVPWEGARRHQGAPDQLPNVYHAVLTFERAAV